MIKLFALDVDGTLTDGKIYISDSGELFKSFDSKDGHALKALLPSAGIITAIITGRKSRIVEKRAEEFDIKEVYQGIDDKAAILRFLTEKYELSINDTAFMGDDLIDMSAMKNCGVSACSADAVDEVKAAAVYVCSKKGGNGAVREFTEWLIRMNKVD